LRRLDYMLTRHKVGWRRSSLSNAFQAQLELVNREYGTNQAVEISRYGANAALHDLDGPPLVEIEITLEPPCEREHAQILVQDSNKRSILKVAPVPVLHRDTTLRARARPNSRAGFKQEVYSQSRTRPSSASGHGVRWKLSGQRDRGCSRPSVSASRSVPHSRSPTHTMAGRPGMKVPAPRTTARAG